MKEVVKCYGLTQDPLNRKYFLVLKLMDMDLRKYLQKNHNQLTWNERIQITFNIFNIINDLGFCGPADKPLKSIYGNLPYIAPEIICGTEYTFASDIYSVGMIMWEISSGQPPFSGFDHDYDLA